MCSHCECLCVISGSCLHLSICPSGAVLQPAAGGDLKGPALFQSVRPDHSQTAARRPGEFGQEHLLHLLQVITPV